MNFKKAFKVSDQLLLTFWSFVLTFVFSNVFTEIEFVGYSLYYTIQAIALLIVNSTYGQMLLLDGRKYTKRSVVYKTLLISSIVFLLLFSVCYVKIIDIKIESIGAQIMFALSLSLFVAFELMRRYLYSLNIYMIALKAVVISMVPLAFGLGIMYYSGSLVLTNFLYLNAASFCIGLLYVIISLNSIPQQSQNLSLSFQNIYDFSKWLILGIVAYIISNRLFLFYLNDIDAHQDLITYRLIETIFGLVLVFVAALENYYISSIRNKKLGYVLKSTSRFWIVFCGLCFGVIVFLEPILQLFFGHNVDLDNTMLIFVLLTYEVTIISRAFVVYIRVNKFNKAIFYSNLLSSVVVIIVFISGFSLSLLDIFILKSIFPISNIIIYCIPYLKYEKKSFNYTRIWSR